MTANLVAAYKTAPCGTQAAASVDEYLAAASKMGSVQQDSTVSGAYMAGFLRSLWTLIKVCCHPITHTLAFDKTPATAAALPIVGRVRDGCSVDCTTRLHSTA